MFKKLIICVTGLYMFNQALFSKIYIFWLILAIFSIINVYSSSTYYMFLINKKNLKV